jgi:hypothetical protein
MGVSSPEVFSGIRVAPSSIFVDHRLSLCPFSFGHHIVRISLFATSYSYKADQVHFKVLVEQELLALHEHSSSPLVLVSDLLFSVYFFIDRCLSFCPFSLGHYIACPSSIYEF